MKINIFGSTGIIGRKTLDIVSKKNPYIKINLLCANKNDKIFLNQIIKYKPNYVYLYDISKLNKIRNKINKKTKILNFEELKSYLKSSKSDFSILAVSGYKSLYYLDEIINNTKNLGIVSKEAIVSAGHIFTKEGYFKKTNIFPLDSEHYSIYEFLNRTNRHNQIKNIYLTASGGPFYLKKYNELSNISFKQAIKHPKWKMGYKNSIDSATLVNKCLELIEAHYLFKISFDKIKILIHPEALVHSIVENDNNISFMNIFKNDMSIPISNFLNSKNFMKTSLNKELSIKNYNTFNFYKVKNEVFPIYNFFKKLDKKKPTNLIKFNIANEYAVNLFKNNSIKYTDIFKIIKKVVSINLNSPVNNIKEIIYYHEEFERKIRTKY